MKHGNVSGKKSNQFKTEYGNSGYVSGGWVDPSWADRGNTSTATFTTQASAKKTTASQRATEKAATQAAAEKAQRQAALTAQMNSSIAQLEQAYQNRRTYLENSYQTSIGAAEGNHKTTVAGVNAGIDRSLQEAYISYMKNKEALPQTLSSLGIHGGMAESTAARLANNYGAVRGSLESTRAGQLADALATLEKQREALLREYQTGLTTEQSNRAKAESDLRLQYAKLF